MRRILGQAWIWAIAGLVLVVGLIGCNTYLKYQGWAAKRLEPTELSKLLSPYYRSFRPAGDGPWPTALLMSGCDGPKDNLERWAATLNEAGWAAIIVDSHTPRDYDEVQRWRLVCAGQVLTGGERAGDIAVAIEDARAMPFVDPDRILLMGSSHGGWSILDLLVLHGKGRRPYNLTRWPDSIADRGLDGIAGTVLLYPYCGAASQVSRHGWSENIPSLFLLVHGDKIADELPCLEVADRAKQNGLDVEAHVLEGTTHGFDQVEKNLFSILEFSPDSTRKAQGIALDFLDRLSGE